MKLTGFLIWLGALLMLNSPVGAVESEVNGFNVLCYHNVMDNPLDHPEKYTVSTEALAQQFSWLKEQGYKVISVDDLLASKAKGKPLPAKAVILTFDDGYRSFYTHIFPLLKKFNYPAVFALVGSWLELKPGEKAQYEGQSYTRDKFLVAAEIRKMAASGLVEFASHSYNLHHGITANPQGNQLPAAVSRVYDTNKKSYENDAAYSYRIRADLVKNSRIIKRLTGKRPRIMVWPYGSYNKTGVDVARSLGMQINFTLGGRVNLLNDPLGEISRVLIDYNHTVARLSDDLAVPDNAPPERVMHVDLDRIYDMSPVLQEEHLDKLLDRVKSMKVSSVYLQAYSDQDGNGAAESVYFPSRHLPLRADLFNRVSWQLKTRAEVKVFASMPLLAFDLPAGNRLANHLVESDTSKISKERYPRLTPFDPEVRQWVTELYKDLAKSALFDGIVFRDDATLGKYEDASSWALGYYSSEWGLPKSISEIRGIPASLKKWKQDKTRYLTEFSLELVDVVRQFQPGLKTARNLYAEVALNPDAEERYAQSLPDFLQNYDYSIVMVMPDMEKYEKPIPWLEKLVGEVSNQSDTLQNVVFELQSVDRHASEVVGSHELANQMELLQLEGALNFGYYPDDFLNNSPSSDVIRPFFSLQTFPFSKN